MQGAASHSVGERLSGREICGTTHGAFPAMAFHGGFAGDGHVSFRVFFFWGLQCLSMFEFHHVHRFSQNPFAVGEIGDCLRCAALCD